MKYNKTFTKGDGRQLLRGGPRDMQTRQRLMESTAAEQDVLIDILRKEITELKGELSNRPTSRGTGEFTAEELNDEVNKAVADTIKELNEKFDKERSELKSEIRELAKKVDSDELWIANYKDKIKTLEERLAERDGIIKDLRDAISRISTTSVAAEIEDDRPKIEDVFIDPLDEDAGSDLESHIRVEDVSVEEKEAIADKVNKLKNIMGKLPKK